MSSTDRPDLVFAAAITWGCGGVLVVLALWSVACVAACILELRPTDVRRPAPDWLTPRLVRLLVAATLGTGVTALPSPVAGGALPDRPSPARRDPVIAPDRVAGLRLPDRVTHALLPVRHVVRPGDSLWSITVQRWPGRPGAGEVDRGWRALYRANRATVGPDPNLIHPGTSLRLPALLVPPSTSRGER